MNHEHVGHAFADDGEGQIPDIAHGDALGDGGAADRDGHAGEPLGEGRVALDLDADDFDARLERGRGNRHARDHAAAAHRDDERVDFGRVREQLERQRALPGDHRGIVVGMDHGEPLALGQ